MQEEKWTKGVAKKQWKQQEVVRSTASQESGEQQPDREEKCKMQMLGGKQQSRGTERVFATPGAAFALGGELRPFSG